MGKQLREAAEIRTCQPQSKAVWEGVWAPREGAPLGHPRLVCTWGQEFGHWVSLSMGSHRLQLSAAHSSLWRPAPGGLGLALQNNSSINMLMGLREAGRNVGPTASGDGGETSQRQVCREEEESEGRRGSQQRGGRPK